MSIGVYLLELCYKNPLQHTIYQINRITAGELDTASTAIHEATNVDIILIPLY